MDAINDEGKIIVRSFSLEDVFGKDFFTSVKREGSPTLVNEYECVGCGTVRNLIRKQDINEPVYCKPCLFKKMKEEGDDRNTE